MEAEEALTDSPADFYVYVHRRATDGLVFYVGKGRRRRAWDTTRRNQFWHNVVAKHGRTVHLVETGLSEKVALSIERELISKFGRDNLCNLNDGGVGNSGWTMPDWHKQKLIAWHKGRKRPPEWVAKMSAANRGQVVSPEHRAAIRAKLKGQVLSAETRAKMSAARTGLRHTEAARQNMKSSWTDERRAMIGRVSSERMKRPVICVDTGERFNSMDDAVAWLRTFRNCSGSSHISQCCAGRRQSAYGYRWQYA